MMRQVMPTAIGVISIGTMMMVLRTVKPLSLRLKSRASRIAKVRDSPTESTVNSSVSRIECRNWASASASA